MVHCGGLLTIEARAEVPFVYSSEGPPMGHPRHLIARTGPDGHAAWW